MIMEELHRSDNFNNEVSPRIENLRNLFLDSIPEISTERAILATESYRQTQGQPFINRRAKAFERILQNISINIFDGELIAGNLTDKPRGAPLFPEYGVDYILEEMDEFSERKVDPFFISEESKDLLRTVLPVWQGNSLSDEAFRLFPDESKEAMENLIFILTVVRSGVAHLVVDYGMALRKGLNGIIEDAENHIQSASAEDPEIGEKMQFWKAVTVVSRAVIGFSQRYALLAENMALSESNPIRRDELISIARICSKVPAEPAESFWEAVQSFWFIHLAIQMESNGHSVSPGRFDQYMYRYYHDDLQKGILSQGFCRELMDCLWIKFNFVNKVRDKVSSVAFAGYPMYQNLILGGQTREGKCAVNDLSHLCLEATARIRLPQPSLSVRWYFGMPKDFIRKACWVSSLGTGMPAFFNDEILVPLMIQQGYTGEEARDYAIVGCVEPTVPGISQQWLTGGFFNMAKILELTIFDGFDPVTGKEFSFKSGPVEELETFDEFKNAYFAGMAHYLKLGVLCDNILDELHADICPTPFESQFVKDCLVDGRSVLGGGARHNFTSIQAVGAANVADSLAVIRKFVYQDKTLSWQDMKKILMNNFEDHEGLRLRFINEVPKYGNDDDSVDDLARELLDRFAAELSRYTNPRGGSFQGAFYTISCHVLFAEKVGATPDGRTREMLLADGGVSCAQGRDTRGPTALMKSVSKLDHFKMPAGALFNMKLSPSVFETDEGLWKVAALVETFFLRKGQHIQFNVIDTDLLREAQRNPDKYPNLVVRVAGYSVLFNALDKVAQDDIILRSEHASA